MRGWLAYLKREWTKNAGKPIEDWESGFDLKDVVLRGLAVIATGALMALLVAKLFR